MPAEQKNPIEVTIAAIAWTQFLVVVTVVEKSDLKRLNDAWRQIVDVTDPIKWDWSAFGSVAAALNIAAVCFFTFPLLVHSAGWKKKKEEEAADKKFSKILGSVGYIFWIFSLLFFIGYLNPWYLLFAVLAVLIGGGLMAYGSPKKG